MMLHIHKDLLGSAPGLIFEIQLSKGKMSMCILDELAADYRAKHPASSLKEVIYCL